MARQGINTGTNPNDGLGDSLLDGAVKINSNFSEIYSTFGNGTTLVSYANTSGISTSVIGGIGSITQLSVSGVSTFAGITTVTGVTLFSKQLNVSGVSTFAGITTHTASLFGTQGSFTGVVTASSFNGNASSATYATTAGISTVAQGLTGTPNITVGIITATNVTIGTATTALIVTGNARISGATTITGNLNAPGNYYVKLARTTNQTILNATDTLIGCSVVSDPNNWYSGITTRTTPTVAGTYHVDMMLNWQAGSITNDQTNIQIRKNGTTFALSQVGIRTFAYTMNACGIVTMNGTTDYIEFTAYTSNPTSQVVNGTADGAWTKMEIFKIN